ncbi:MAG: hypothetical protein AAGI24_04335 [Pseudomonadota bacterium]
MRFLLKQRMKHGATRSLICILLCTGGLQTNVLAQASAGAEVAETMSAEARALRIQTLEREAAQYRASVDLLRANGADMEGAAIRALAGELKEIREEISALQRERQTSTELMSSTAPSPSAGSDANRLKQLLAAHYAEEAASDTSSDASIAAGNEATVVTLDEYKVSLTGNEGVLALQKIEERLGNAIPNGRARDLVFHVETRVNGALVKSGSHSMRSLSEDQFIARIPLGPGTTRITVRGEGEWQVELDSVAGSEYLVTLYKPQEIVPQLHLIPVTELKAASVAELPGWLPASGADAARS